MQVKIFLSSLLATLYAAGVTSTPTGVEARDIKSSHGWDGTVTPLEKVASLVGDIKPLPKGPILTPKDNDVPVVSTNVEPRGFQSLAKRTPGCIFVSADSNFSGNNFYFCVPTNGGCNNWGSYWRYSISSFGPDPGTWCQMFDLPNCAGTGSSIFVSPGYGMLGSWNDNMGSFRCWW